MQNRIIIKKKIGNYNKKITIPGDKSLSIRWVLISSLANGISQAKNLLMSEDVIATINAIRKLGVRAKINNKICKIHGVGINGFKYKKNLVIDAQNSGTLGRLLAGLLINSPYPIKIIGDKSLSKRDFKRIAQPLKKFGANLRLKNNYTLPLTIKGSQNLKPIRYLENKGSAQVKSCIIFAGARTNGKTIIKCKQSRDHSERIFKYLKLPIKIKRKKNYDLIEISKVKKIKPINYKIPSDLSSCAFFIALTALSGKSKLTIKEVNINPTRTGVLTILKKMGVKISFFNKKIYKGEPIADIFIQSPKMLKSINCPSNLNSAAIDEFLVLFLIAAKAKGVSFFKNLDELNKKESPRLKWGSKILKMMGVKVITTKNSIKIFGNPELKTNKKIIIKNYLKDHRVFMTSVIAALSFTDGGVWSIANPESVKTSFPNFLKIINQLKK
uniref:3-phosphoshikimate 1-carboxyvinyltransferase n=1 Tax=uncultured SAR11 cluster bacterium HF0010_09O16 TaxID=710725 RepID=E0XWZ6_9PROT|nr:5-enolpyruvylshikimate-3-phosphate synthase [uncultured SAR11 cluster bacterium HF0010_09O16]